MVWYPKADEDQNAPIYERHESLSKLKRELEAIHGEK
jgi:hypothetical protein